MQCLSVYVDSKLLRRPGRKKLLHSVKNAKRTRSGRKTLPGEESVVRESDRAPRPTFLLGVPFLAGRLTFIARNIIARGPRPSFLPPSRHLPAVLPFPGPTPPGLPELFHLEMDRSGDISASPAL
ncbi:hypothetical protein HPB47_000137 [Ixodes persulcatus]|uniref:Uncharacterized protein n=1 Tax=Ixodes persulcatus TaxID=34615 RepID=A0AC60PSY3_IXOPE|nr:hypothetical protein HPB47_000137 [Ixodes persulcatus]